MIGIAAQVYDDQGARIFESATEQNNRQGSRRLSRTATLDGGVWINDGGYCDGDRDFTVQELNATIEAIEFAQRVVESYNLVTISTDHGVYSAAPSTYEVSDGGVTMKFLVKEKLT
jgi:hypothetical protein